MARLAAPALLSTTMEALTKEQAEEQQMDEIRQHDRQEFFRTYDLMTGVRIAATLGGFFGMMVLLVLYKSRCRTRRDAIKEVRLAAAMAVVEEEDQQEAVAAAIYMQTVVTGRVPRRSLGALSAPVGPTGPRGSLAFIGGALGSGPGDVPAVGAADGGVLLPRAAFVPEGGGEEAEGGGGAVVRPFPLPVRFSSLGGCSLLDATVAITSVRRASMLPAPPARHLHKRLERNAQLRRESRQLQAQRLQQLLPRLDGDGEAADPTATLAVMEGVPRPKGARTRSASVHGAPPSAADGAAGLRRHSHARGPAATPGVAVVSPAQRRSSASPFLGLGHGPFRPRTPLGVIDSSPEGVCSPVGSAILGGEPAGLPSTPSPLTLSAQDGHDSNGNNSLSYQVLPYGAHCESFELVELAYGEAAVPLARISTLEAASLKEGDSGSDSAFGVLPTQHGQAPDTAADTGVDTGQDADTDQDADGQLSTDSNGSSSTPHQPANHEHRLYVLPVGVAPRSGSSVVTLHEEPNPSRSRQPAKHARLRPRLARTSKVVASLDSAASDDCITTTPEQSQDEPELLPSRVHADHVQ